MTTNIQTVFYGGIIFKNNKLISGEKERGLVRNASILSALNKKNKIIKDTKY